jgi:GDP-L-fucose synthase
MNNYDSPEFVNIGWGKDISIKELAETIAQLTGYSGEIKWDSTKPDGMPRKCMDVSKMTEIGFKPEIGLIQGLERTISEYRELV